MDIKMKIRAYARVSTKKQGDKYGLGSQLADIERYCKHRFPDAPVISYLEDGVSGTVAPDDRPAFSLLLLEMEQGDVIVSTEVSRLSRVMWHGSKLHNDTKESLSEISCINAPDATFSISGSMQFHMMLIFAATERETSRARQDSGRAEKGKDGGYVAGPPPAWTKLEDGKVVLDTEKIKRIIEVKSLVEQKTPYSKIADVMGITKGTISKWKKEFTDPSSEMSKAIEDYKNENDG